MANTLHANMMQSTGPSFARSITATNSFEVSSTFSNCLSPLTLVSYLVGVHHHHVSTQTSDTFLGIHRKHLYLSSIMMLCSSLQNRLARMMSHVFLAFVLVSNPLPLICCIQYSSSYQCLGIQTLFFSILRFPRNHSSPFHSGPFGFYSCSRCFLKTHFSGDSYLLEVLLQEEIEEATMKMIATHTLHQVKSSGAQGWCTKETK